MPTTSRHSSKLTTLTLALGLALSFPLAAQAQANTVTFNIAQQPLAQALNQLAEQANMSLIADASLLENLQAPALYGQRTVRDALTQALQGTAITAEIVGNNIILKAANVTAANVTVAAGMQPDSANIDKHQRDIEVIVVKGDQIHLNRDEIERTKGSSNSDIFSTHTSIETNNIRNEAGALDIGIRGVQGEGRVPVFIDGSLQSTHTNRGYMGTSDRTYIDSDLISTVSIEKGSSIKGSLFNAGAIGGTVDIRTLSTQDILKEGKDAGALIKLKTYNNNKMPDVGSDAWQQEYYRISNHNDTLDFENGGIMLATAYQTEKLKAVLALSHKKTGNYFAGTHGYDNFTQELLWGTSRPPVNQGGEVVNTSFESQSYLAKLHYQFTDEHELEINTRHHQQEAGELLASYWYKIEEGDYWRLPDGTYDLVPEGIEMMPQWEPGSAIVNSASAVYRFLPTNNSLIDLKVNAWTTNANLKQYNALGSNLGPNSLQYLHQYENKRNGLGVYNTSSFNVTPTIPATLILGFSWQDERLRPKEGWQEFFYGDTATSRNGKQTVTSAFANAQIDLDPVELVLNLNHHDSENQDYQTGLTEHFDPKTDVTAQIYYRVFGNTTLKAKFSRAYRMPNLYETTVSNEVFSYSPYYPVTPEKTHSFETGIESNFNDLLLNGDKLVLSATYFNTQIDDMLATADLPNKDPNAEAWETTQYTFTNYDSFKLPGIELALNYQGDLFYGSVSYTNYTNIEICSSDFSEIEGVEQCNSQGFSGSLTPLRIPPKRNLVATIGKAFFNDKLDTGLIYKGHSEKNHPAGFLSGTGADAISKIPASYQLDFYADYRFNSTFSGYTTVTNLTDRYTVSSGSVVAMPEPGRTITIGLEIKL